MAVHERGESPWPNGFREAWHGLERRRQHGPAETGDKEERYLAGQQLVSDREALLAGEEIYVEHGAIQRLNSGDPQGGGDGCERANDGAAELGEDALELHRDQRLILDQQYPGRSRSRARVHRRKIARVSHHPPWLARALLRFSGK